MARIKVIRNTYGGDEYLWNGCHYIHDPKKAIVSGGYGVNYSNPVAVYTQMKTIKKMFNKESGNPLAHIIVSFSGSVNDLETALKYADVCAVYFSNRFQVYYCLHNKDAGCSHYHVHMIINSVSYKNGKMISTGDDTMSPYTEFVSKLLNEYSHYYFPTKKEIKEAKGDLSF